MTGAEIVALTSVVVTGIAAPWISSRMARRQAELQTRHAREDELRLVLENAGVKLTDAIGIVGQASDLSKPNPSATKQLWAEIEQLRKNEDRIRVRLGSSSAEAEEYRRAIEKGIIPARSVLLQAQGISTPPPTLVQALLNAQKVAVDAQTDFYAAASARTGPGELTRRLQIPLLGRGGKSDS